MSASKAKGTAAETAVVKCLRENGFPYAERRALGGVNDKGDVAGLPGVVIEVKSCARTELSNWLAEARQEAANAEVGIYAVWAKKRGWTGMWSCRERAGVVGPAEGNAARPVLMTVEELP